MTRFLHTSREGGLPVVNGIPLWAACGDIKAESIRKLSNFDFQWTKTLYQNILNNTTFYFTFFKDSGAIDVMSCL